MTAYIDLPSDFYNGRFGYRPRYIILHTTQGNDSRAWLTKTGSVSAHYLLRNEWDRGPVAYRLVGEGYAAWHAGVVVGEPTNPVVAGSRQPDGSWVPNPNLESIGIEIEGYANGPVDAALVALCAEVVTDIRQRWGPLPLVDHREVSPGSRSDPGIWRAAIDNALEDDMAFTDMDRAKLDRVLEIAEALLAAETANEPLVWTARAQRGLDVETGKPLNLGKQPEDPRIVQ